MRIASTLLFLHSFLYTGTGVYAQKTGDAATITSGAALFGQRCSVCHGANARGGEAPDLTRSQVVISGTQKELSGVVRNGIPGTEMPPLGLSDEQSTAIIAYLYSIARPGMGPPVSGNAEAGKRVFEQAGCSHCHTIAGRGGFLGPDLSSIALQRFTAGIRDRILHPGAFIASGYQPVRITTRRKKVTDGLLKNEDNFSLQILQADGGYASIGRDDVSSIAFQPAALMPGDYGNKLSETQLQDLLAFLDQQRAPATSLDIRPVVY